MAMAKIKTDEERARLDAIFAEIKAMERGEIPQKEDSRTPAQTAEDKRKAKIDRLANADIKEFLGNVKANIGNGAFTTKWEIILSRFIVERMTPMNEELNILLLCHSQIKTVNNPTGDRKGWDSIGASRWYETMAFVAKVDGDFIEADVHKSIYTYGGQWQIDREPDGKTDLEAEKMHEDFVAFVMEHFDECYKDGEEYGRDR